MQRYFIRQSQMDATHGQTTITGDDVNHIVKVMRFTPGDKVICCDETGHCFVALITAMGKDSVICDIREDILDDRELPVHVALAQGIAKGDKMDYIIQKGTEMGMADFIPFNSSRTVVQLDDKKEQKRLQRWEKIAKEAAEQSHRRYIPRIQQVHSWKKLLKLCSQYDLALIAYEKESIVTIHKQFQHCPAKGRILLIIGPEGGFSETEVNEAAREGACAVMLGKRILRTETAGLYALACASYYFEQMVGR